MEYIDYVEEYGTRPIRIPRSVKDRSDPFVELNDFEFVDRFWLHKWDVIELHDQLMELLSSPSANNRGMPISDMMKLLVSLRFYATGIFHRENADLLGISESSASRVLHQTNCNSTVLQFPDEFQRRKCKWISLRLQTFQVSWKYVVWYECDKNHVFVLYEYRISLYDVIILLLLFPF